MTYHANDPGLLWKDKTVEKWESLVASLFGSPYLILASHTA